MRWRPLAFATGCGVLAVMLGSKKRSAFAELFDILSSKMGTGLGSIASSFVGGSTKGGINSGAWVGPDTTEQSGA